MTPREVAELRLQTQRLLQRTRAERQRSQELLLQIQSQTLRLRSSQAVLGRARVTSSWLAQQRARVTQAQRELERLRGGPVFLLSPTPDLGREPG